mmetsp:Transcript_13598/g.34195  ORF Transcript_13598/g.34195 Transcript_13598/m.34195 type:complete len:210 (-) Transcript_13598:379-1008(-)
MCPTRANARHRATSVCPCGRRAPHAKILRTRHRGKQHCGNSGHTRRSRSLEAPATPRRRYPCRWRRAASDPPRARRPTGTPPWEVAAPATTTPPAEAPRCSARRSATSSGGRAPLASTRRAAPAGATPATSPGPPCSEPRRHRRRAAQAPRGRHTQRPRLGCRRPLATWRASSPGRSGWALSRGCCRTAPPLSRPCPSGGGSPWRAGRT